MMNSLLPPNATPLERALEVAGGRIVDVNAPADIDDPMTCPAELLPWLAWGLSVDTWDAGWTEADKRAAVAGSIELHRRKGTRVSVEIVLARFDQLIQIIEWHETAPRGTPHTFDVVIPLVTADGVAPGGRRASAAFVDAIIREVSRVKPLREHMRVVQQIALRTRIAIAVAARVATFDRSQLELVSDTSPIWATLLQTEDGEPLSDDAGEFLDDTP
jgi:phage tail P2-like protein